MGGGVSYRSKDRESINRDDLKPGKAASRGSHIFAPQARPLGTCAFRFTVFLFSAAMFGNCARHGKSRKEQITMIAQKIIYAKHAQK